MRPAAHPRTVIEGYTFKIYPENHFINWQQDPFGNYQARVVFNEKITELRVELEVIAKLKVINPFEFFVEEYAETLPFLYKNKLHKELWPSSSSYEESAPLINTTTVSRFVSQNKNNLKPDIPIELVNSEYPNTLDLRHFWVAKK